MSSQNIVHMPTPADVEQAKLSSRTLSKYTDVDRVNLSLRGSNGESDDLVLPGHVLQILLDVLSEMSKGNAISLIPHHQEVSTQEAANLLNVSRPHIHEEWINALLRKNTFTREKLERVRDLMDAHAKDARVTGYELLIDTLDLPDPDDRHVLAAAICCGADAIVTFNLKDFPKDKLAHYGIEVIHPDDFIYYGMPTFYGLTKHVIDFFDPPKNSTIAVEFSPWVEDFKSNKERPKTPLDQIFNLLYSEYGRDEVNAIVVSKLQGGESELKNSDQHQVIARISSDLEGNAQIVTTNFDLLFEQAIEQEVIKVYEPPAFPDIGLGVPLTGITYLHGRLQEEAAKLHPYVLSSADFGRAYLSEGWATNFIRLLLKSYTVVLLGYQAEDLPVKYLLQGLNHDGLSDRSSLYAFDVGKIEDIETKWRDRGVTVIPCNDYTSLWETLGAWADRADDPRKWRSSVVDMAMKGPLQLEAHERGQVAHLVRTTPGARLFANSTPSPPPEWLCVFDSGCRAGKESSNYGSGETFDPLDAFGLDDDPSRPLEPGWQSNSIYGHILEWRKGDINPPDFHNLSNRQAVGFENLPPRLSHLSNWIYKHIDKPVVAWWAARQNGLHPVLLRSIQIELRRNKDLHPAALRTWNLIVEYQTDSRILYRGEDWFEIKARISNEGWTSSVIRQFALTTAPILSMESPLGLEASKPPLGDWEENSIRRIAKWAAKFPDRYRESVDVPNEVLDVVFRISEGHFRQLSGLIQDTGTNYISSPTCYPNRDVDGADDKRHEVFKWFLQLFERMVLSHPEKGRASKTVA